MMLTLNTVFYTSSKSSFSLWPFTPSEEPQGTTSWRRDAETLYKSEQRSPMTVWLTELCGRPASCISVRSPRVTKLSFMERFSPRAGRFNSAPSNKHNQKQKSMHAGVMPAHADVQGMHCVYLPRRRLCIGFTSCMKVQRTPPLLYWEFSTNIFLHMNPVELCALTGSRSVPVRDSHSHFLGLSTKRFKNIWRVKQVRL